MRQDIWDPEFQTSITIYIIIIFLINIYILVILANAGIQRVKGTPKTKNPAKSGIFFCLNVHFIIYLSAAHTEM